MAFTTNYELEEKAYAIEQGLQTPEGRRIIAQKMMEPIKRERDYVGMGRQGLIIDNLGQGQIPYYDSDIKTRAVVIPNRGEIPQERINANRVMVPIFPLASFPMVSIEDAKLRRYNIIERVQTKTRADLAEEEDRLIFGDLNTVDFSQSTYGGQNQRTRGVYTLSDGAGSTTTGSVSMYRFATPETNDGWYSSGTWTGGEDMFDNFANPVTYSNQGLTKEFLSGLYTAILQHDIIPEAYLMNPVDYADFWTWSRDDFDPETQKDVLKTGRMGSIWNTEIHTSKIVPRGTVFCRTSDEYLGVMPILIDLEVMDAPDPKSLAYGWAFYEYVGMSILNCWGISRGTVTR